MQCAESQPQPQKSESPGAGLELRDTSLKPCRKVEPQRDEHTRQVTCPELDEGPPCLLILVLCLWAPSYIEIYKLLEDKRDGFHLNTQRPPTCFHMHQSLRIAPLSPFARNRSPSNNGFLPQVQGFFSPLLALQRPWVQIYFPSCL